MTKKISIVIICALFLGMVFSGGCFGGQEAQPGDTVRVHYTGMFLDGSVFDSSAGAEPLEFTLGEGTVINGFNAAVLGMKVGEKKTVTIPYAEAYGEYRDDLAMELDRSLLAEGSEPYVGQQMQVMLTSGDVIVAVIIAVNEATVTVDTNHPLAGQDLVFEIELVEIAGDH